MSLLLSSFLLLHSIAQWARNSHLGSFVVGIAQKIEVVVILMMILILCEITGVYLDRVRREGFFSGIGKHTSIRMYIAHIFFFLSVSGSVKNMSWQTHVHHLLACYEKRASSIYNFFVSYYKVLLSYLFFTVTIVLAAVVTLFIRFSSGDSFQVQIHCIECFFSS